MQYKRKTIEWISCIFAPMQDANSTTIEIMCKAGSIYENQANNGISHFLEHLFFKGGKKYPTPKSVAEALDSFGGESNAYTGDEYAGYYVKCAPEFVHRALDVLGDMMIHATFPAEELEREKGVVIQELKMYEDNPMAMVMQKWQRFYYGDNSYGWPIIGTIDNINSFTQEKLFEHKADLYTKDNLLITIAGKIDDEEAISTQIGTLFKDLPNQKRIQKPAFSVHTPTEKVGNFEQKNEQTHLVISCPGFDGYNEKKYAANVLATILGGNMSSRLFQRIREKEGLCYYIKGVHGANQDSGVFLIRAGIDKARFDYGVKRIFEELNNIANGDLTQEEFDNAIGYTKGQIQMGIESSDEMASFLGSQELLYNKIETLDEVVKKYEKLTLDDIQELAGMLSEDKCYLFYIK